CWESSIAPTTLSPFQGCLWDHRSPWADAHGYSPPPLRGCQHARSFRPSLSAVLFQLIDHLPKPRELLRGKPVPFGEGEDQGERVAVAEFARDVRHAGVHFVLAGDDSPEHKRKPALVAG